MKDAVNVFYGMLLSPLITVLIPIHDFLKFAMLVFLVNFFFGWLEDVINGDGWQWKKATMFLFHCFIFFGFVTFVFVAAHLQHYSDDNTLFIIRTGGNAVMYIFTTNIVKNICKVLPKGSPMWTLFSWLYAFMTAQFIAKIPMMREYLKLKDKDNDNK